ncbi:hypothetical protein M441DRAFT_385035 [Trichoderma asperellum CBS 433.97]|uniref:Uncharacterized protein n=1 Tax=Trichoderma asperellum (strain ATCC 204424 / CBS 433.97 / NBRC 101777) TaxID=1042311 RepID=A0A2T3ZBJ7_TRIA4|nr:hypothetical protein M441DRAFT_385035 [Trichoderma asperellum CBS 433.97]PTB42150.1 hypothetical protein M441DRAFT_385035 [Trichoderma asperellum CBS 433.97]
MRRQNVTRDCYILPASDLLGECIARRASAASPAMVQLPKHEVCSSGRYSTSRARQTSVPVLSDLGVIVPRIKYTARSVYLAAETKPQRHAPACQTHSAGVLRFRGALMRLGRTFGKLLPMPTRCSQRQEGARAAVLARGFNSDHLDRSGLVRPCARPRVHPFAFKAQILFSSSFPSPPIPAALLSSSLPPLRIRWARIPLPFSFCSCHAG